MAAMEGVESWLRWFLLVSAQSWRRHRPRRRGHVGRAKRRPRPGWWVLGSRGGIRPILALWSPIPPRSSPCDRHACCLCWISLSCDLSFLEKYTLLSIFPSETEILFTRLFSVRLYGSHRSHTFGFTPMG